MHGGRPRQGDSAEVLWNASDSGEAARAGRSGDGRRPPHSPPAPRVVPWRADPPRRVRAELCPPRATSRGMHAGRAGCMQGRAGCMHGREGRAGCMQGREGRAGCMQGRVRQGQDACMRGCIGGAGERGRAVRPSAAGAAATSRYRSPGPQSQTQSDAIRRNQTQSDAIRRNQTAHLDRRQQD